MKVVGFSSKASKILSMTGVVAVEVNITCIAFSSFEGELLRGTIRKNLEEGIVGTRG